MVIHSHTDIVESSNRTPVKVVTAFLVVLIAVAAAAILANSMTKPLGHDEQMYCTAGVLLAEGKTIYRDFSYVAQMPYHPLLCAGLFKALDTTHYLLTVRLLSTVCDILIAACIVVIYRRIFGPRMVIGSLLGAACLVLYLFNPFVDYANGFAWNHDPVVLCVVISLVLFTSTGPEGRASRRRIALAGALLTLATCMRITTGLIELMFLVFLLVRPGRPLPQRLRNAAYFLIAAATVVVWPAWLIISAPRAVGLNLFQIPKLNAQFLEQTGLVFEKSKLALAFVTTPACLLLVLIAFCLCIALLLNRRSLKTPKAAQAVLALLPASAFFVIAFIPPTAWIQYFAAPVPFVLISFALPISWLSRLRNRTCFNGIAIFIAASALLAVVFHPVVLKRIPKLFDANSWVPLELHNTSLDIAERTESPGPILTLAPLFAIEGGCDIYTEFSAGPFAYRVADRLSPANRAVTHTVGPESLEKLIKTTNPSAVLLGQEPKNVETPLLRATVQTQPDAWEKQTYPDELVVYFKRHANSTD